MEMNEEIFMQSLPNRHPSTIHMVAQLQPNPNLATPEYDIAHRIWGISMSCIANIDDGPELTAGLRKLLEAKDCLVRASLDLQPVYYTDR